MPHASDSVSHRPPNILSSPQSIFIFLLFNFNFKFPRGCHHKVYNVWSQWLAAGIDISNVRSIFIFIILMLISCTTILHQLRCTARQTSCPTTFRPMYCNGHIIFICYYLLILILHCYGYMCHVCMERQAHPANDRATCVFHGNHFHFLSFFNFNFSCSHGRNGMPKCPYRGQFGLQ